MLRSWNEWHILSDLQWNAFAFGIFAFVRSGNKLHANVTTDCSGLLSLPAVWRFFTASFCPTSDGRGPLSATPLRWRRRMMQRWGEATLGVSREGILMRSFVRPRANPLLGCMRTGQDEEIIWSFGWKTMLDNWLEWTSPLCGFVPTPNALKWGDMQWAKSAIITQKQGYKVFRHSEDVGQLVEGRLVVNMRLLVSCSSKRVGMYSTWFNNPFRSFWPFLVLLLGMESLRAIFVFAIGRGMLWVSRRYPSASEHGALDMNKCSNKTN